MKTACKIAFTLILLFALERGIRTQTDGFRLEKTYASALMPFPSTPHQPLPKELTQNFYFLGSGVQCYAFLGEDQTTVLKLFKHYHFGLPTDLFARLPLPASWKEKTLAKRQKRIHKILQSADSAASNLMATTGTLFADLSPQNSSYPTITLFDKIGIARSLDLRRAPFLLQTKAEPLYHHLRQHPETTKEVIDSFFQCLKHRLSKGFINTDPIAGKNFGIHEGKVIEIDIGSFEQKAPLHKADLTYETLDFEEWIQNFCPEHHDYFCQKRLEATPS